MEDLLFLKRGSNSIDGSAKWWCSCECGSLREILAGSLRQGLTTSCGCAQKDSVRKYFSDPKNIQKRKDNHVQKINSFKRVKLVGKYERDDINTEYKCLLHNEIHFAKPTNVAQGFGLKCCQLFAITETSNKKKSEAEEKYFKSIKNKFELLEKYVGKEIKILHYCFKHKEIHLASPAQINKGSGLKCCGREKLKINGRKKSEKAAEEYDFKISKFGRLKRIGKYIRSDVAIIHECLIHRERHPATPDSGISGKGLKCCFEAGKKNYLKKRSDLYLNKLIKFCKRKDSKVSYIDGYTKSSKPANFFCNIHQKYLQGYPNNVLNGSGLACCRRGGVETIDQAINGEIWNQYEETWVYIYELKKYPEFLKFGISNDPEERSADEEYGEEVCSWLMGSRLDAFLIEEAIFHQTSIFQDYPSQLKNWEGYTEIRKCSEEDLIQFVQSLIDHFYEINNKWQFVLDEIPLSSVQENKVEKLKKGIKDIEVSYK